MKHLTEKRLEELVIKIIGYHEYACGNGWRAGDIKKGIRLGWIEAIKATATAEREEDEM